MDSLVVTEGQGGSYRPSALWFCHSLISTPWSPALNIMKCQSLGHSGWGISDYLTHLTNRGDQALVRSLLFKHSGLQRLHNI